MSAQGLRGSCQFVERLVQLPAGVPYSSYEYTLDQRVRDFSLPLPAQGGEQRVARYCQLIEADAVIRQTGTLPRSSLPLRQPACCP